MGKCPCEIEWILKDKFDIKLFLHHIPWTKYAVIGLKSPPFGILMSQTNWCDFNRHPAIPEILFRRFGHNSSCAQNYPLALFLQLEINTKTKTPFSPKILLQERELPSAAWIFQLTKNGHNLMLNETCYLFIHFAFNWSQKGGWMGCEWKFGISHHVPVISFVLLGGCFLLLGITDWNFKLKMSRKCWKFQNRPPLPFILSVRNFHLVKIEYRNEKEVSTLIIILKYGQTNMGNVCTRLKNYFNE